MKNIKYIIVTLILFMSTEMVSASKAYKTDDFVYFDPVSNNTCNETNYWTIYNQDTTCYRFVVLEPNDTEDSSTLKIMLDHNVWYGRFEYYADGLKSATSNWNRHIGAVDIIDEETVYEVMELTAKPTLDNISVNGGSPYMYFTTNSLYVIDGKKYAYWGFWTKDKYNDNYAYTITENGNNRLVSIAKTSSGNYNQRGIRPVITVNKKLLEFADARDITSFLENGTENKFQYTTQKYDGYIYKQLQGFTFTNDKFIFHSAHAENTEFGLMDVYGYSYNNSKVTFTDLKRRVYSDTGHGNDLTYNSKSNSVVMVGPSSYEEIYVYDADKIADEASTVEKISAYDTTGNLAKYAGIGYDVYHNYYFALSSGRIYVLDSEFKQLYSFDAPANEHYQGIEYHNGYLYFTTFAYNKSNCPLCVSNPWSSITYVYNAKFDSNGKPSKDFGRLVDRLYVGTEFGELESVAFNSNNIYFGFASAASKFNSGYDVYKFYSFPYDKISYDIDANIAYVNIGSTKSVTISSEEELNSISGWQLSSDKHKLSRKFTDSITISDVNVCDLYNNCTSIALTNIESNSQYLDISKLDVDQNNKLMKNLKLGTKVSELSKNISTNVSLSLLDKNNNELLSNQNVASGSKVKATLDGVTYEYILSVTGDVTGDGKATVADVAKAYQYLKKKIDMDECYKKAGDVVGNDDLIKINDVAKLYQFIKGKIISLEN